MKQFDWEKHPDIDVVAWDKDGKCYSHGVLSSVGWVYYKLPKYDIDPNTPGFDWTQSKQIRPTGFDAEKNSEINRLTLETISQKKRIAELEKLLADEKALHNQCTITKDAYYSELLKWRKDYELGTHKHDTNLVDQLSKATDSIKELEGEVAHYRRLALLKNTNHNEKLIDFWARRYEYWRMTTSNVKGLSASDSKNNATEETELFRQAIERIEKNELQDITCITNYLRMGWWNHCNDSNSISERIDDGAIRNGETK